MLVLKPKALLEPRPREGIPLGRGAIFPHDEGRSHSSRLPGIPGILRSHHAGGLAYDDDKAALGIVHVEKVGMRGEDEVLERKGLGVIGEHRRKGVRLEHDGPVRIDLPDRLDDVPVKGEEVVPLVDAVDEAIGRYRLVEDVIPEQPLQVHEVGDQKTPESYELCPEGLAPPEMVRLPENPEDIHGVGGPLPAHPARHMPALDAPVDLVDLRHRVDTPLGGRPDEVPIALDVLHVVNALGGLGIGPGDPETDEVESEGSDRVQVLLAVSKWVGVVPGHVHSSQEGDPPPRVADIPPFGPEQGKRPRLRRGHGARVLAVAGGHCKSSQENKEKDRNYPNLSRNAHCLASSIVF